MIMILGPFAIPSQLLQSWSGIFSQVFSSDDDAHLDILDDAQADQDANKDCCVGPKGQLRLDVCRDELRGVRGGEPSFLLEGQPGELILHQRRVAIGGVRDLLEPFEARRGGRLRITASGVSSCLP